MNIDHHNNIPAWKEIPLSRGYSAIVDADDYEKLSQHKWTATVSGGKVYAHRRSKLCDGASRAWLIVMHRVIMGLARGDRLCVDHINGNTLDNRKRNLRICTSGENSKNLSRAWGKTGMRGVQQTGNGKWRVRIRVNAELISVGTFDTERDASIAYCFASKHLHGDFGSTPGHSHASE